MPEEKFDAEQMLSSVANLEAARLTLRWSLERIRFLESSSAQALELLKSAQSARDKAVGELESSRQSSERRLQALAQKEKFVSDMQGIFNDLFKGDLSVGELLQERERFKNIEARV